MHLFYCNPCTLRLLFYITDNYQYYQHKTNSLGCTSQDVKFQSLAGYQVYDSQAATCNCDGADGTCNEGTCNVCTGLDLDEVSCELPDGTKLPHETVIGACLGVDDNVNVSIAFNIDVATERYDIGMYIATE